MGLTGGSVNHLLLELWSGRARTGQDAPRHWVAPSPLFVLPAWAFLPCPCQPCGNQAGICHGRPCHRSLSFSLFLSLCESILCAHHSCCSSNNRGQHLSSAAGLFVLSTSNDGAPGNRTTQCFQCPLHWAVSVAGGREGGVGGCRGGRSSPALCVWQKQGCWWPCSWDDVLPLRLSSHMVSLCVRRLLRMSCALRACFTRCSDVCFRYSWPHAAFDTFRLGKSGQSSEHLFSFFLMLHFAWYVENQLLVMFQFWPEYYNYCNLILIHLINESQSEIYFRRNNNFWKFFIFDIFWHVTQQK